MCSYRKLNIKSAALFSTVLMAFSTLSGCTNGSDNDSFESTSTITSEITSEFLSETESVTKTSLNDRVAITENSDISDTSTVSDTDNLSDTAISEITSNESITTTVNDISDTGIISKETSENVTTTVQSTTKLIEITTDIKTIAAQTTTVKPPAKIIIPMVYSVSSPATDVISGTNGTIDYSNSSKGYFSVKYTGKATVVKLRVECSGASKYDHDVEADGKLHYFPLHNGSGKYTIGLYEQVGSSYVQVCSGEVNAKVANETNTYLYPNNYVNFNQNSNLVQKVAEITAGKTSDLDKISAIFTYITSNVTYDKQFAADVKSGKITKHTPDPDTTLKNKTGICYDYASLFAAMARAEGIPAKLVVGYASPDIYHAWNEVYTDETGWITVEFYLSKKGFNRVDATFYSSAADKSTVSEYISKNSNYSSLYIY